MKEKGSLQYEVREEKMVKKNEGKNNCIKREEGEEKKR